MADRLQDERRKSLCCCSGLSTWCRGCAAHLLLLYLKYRLLNHLDDDDGRIMPSSLPCAACQSLSAANNVSNHNHRLFDRNHHHLLLIPPGLSISSVPGYGTPNRWRRTDGTATLDKICVVVKDIITQN